MTRMTGSDCAVMCNLIKYIHTYMEDQCEWHRMTRMTGSDCAVMCNLIKIHTYIHTYIHIYIQRKSAGNRKIVVDAVRETGETRVERERNVEKKVLVQ